MAKIGLKADFPLPDTLRLCVIPRARSGNQPALGPYFTTVTNITETDITQDGVPLGKALERLKAFASGVTLWSWRKDEFNVMAISCYVEGLVPPIPATQFGNACALRLKAGMPDEDIKKTRGNRLADCFQIKHPPLKAHDALDDARSVA